MKWRQTYYRTVILVGLLITLGQLKAKGHKDSIITPDERDTEDGLYLRGKALAWWFLEDWYFANICGGAEFRFKKHESIGADYILYEQFHERDLWDTVTNQELGYGYYAYDLQQMISVDLRHYFGQDIFYGCLFYRYGTRRIWVERDWIYEEGDIHFAKHKFKDVGLACGFSGLYSKRFGVDVQLGIYNRFSRIHKETYHVGSPMEFEESIRKWNIKPVFRLNLIYRLF